MSYETGAYAYNTAVETDLGEWQIPAELVENEESQSRWQAFRSRVGRIAAIGAVFAGASVLAPAAAHADEPTCYGDYCSGLYADDTNCDEDAETLTEAPIKLNNTSISLGPITVGGGEKEVGTLKMRYSEECGTVWSLLETTVDSPIQFLGIEQDTGYDQVRNVAGRVYPAPALRAFTPMIYGRDHMYRSYITSHHPLGLPEEVGTYWTEPGQER